MQYITCMYNLMETGLSLDYTNLDDYISQISIDHTPTVGSNRLLYW